ncbi:MAG: sensor histidine kinase [Pseudonocardia sp.]
MVLDDADDVRGPSRSDVLVAIAAATVDVLAFSDIPGPLPPGLTSPPWLVVGWALLGAAALVWRTRWPLIVTGVLAVHAAAASLLLSYRPTVLLCVALATVAARCATRDLVTAGLLAVVTSGAWVASEVRTSADPVTDAEVVALWALYLVIPLAAAAIGRWARAGTVQRRELERRRVEEARVAVERERRRIAHELHDIVSHAVGVMVIQAAGARRVLDTDPARTDGALRVIEETGGQAVGELRRLLMVLRPGAADDAGPGGRAPALADLAALLATTRATGVEVELVEQGERAALDPSVDLAAYRVVQEALTNAAKQAGDGARATVRLAWSGGGVEVAVDSTGAGPRRPELSTGHGLAGLAERVTLAGGTLDAGPAGDGFRVRATLPTALGPTALGPTAAGPTAVGSRDQAPAGGAAPS